MLPESLNRPFGKTGLSVSALGFGAGQIGDERLQENEAERLLGTVLDLGITLLDTARGYGLSEERIGRHLRHRRHEFVLSTKIGYDIPGYEDWTGPIISAGIDAALQRLQTDVIDIVHLHSCPIETLMRDDIYQALERAVAAGKVRVTAYSGDNEPLEYAIQSGRFGSIETSINIADQWVIDRGLASARERKMGVIAKRPLANAPWRFTERPTGDYSETYWERLSVMQLTPDPLSWDEFALRFTAFLPGVQSCIVGTRNIEHLRRNAALIARGPLPEETIRQVRQAFLAHGANWHGET